MPYRTLSILGALLLAFNLAAQSPKPNFSGEWQMDAAKSEFSKFPMPTALTRVVTHKGANLDIDTTQRSSAGEQTAHAHYRTDGVETTNQFSSGTGTSHAFWDGNTLVIRTTTKVKNDIDVLMEERWTLSDDQKTLTTISHIETSGGEIELKLVCNRTK